MPATKRLVLDLPEEVADTIAAHVSSGEYADATHVVAAGVGSLPGADDTDLGDLDEDSPSGRRSLRSATTLSDASTPAWSAPTLSTRSSTVLRLAPERGRRGAWPLEDARRPPATQRRARPQIHR